MSFCGCQSTIRSSLQPARLLSPPLVRQPCCSARSGLHGRDQTQRDSAIMKRDNDMGLFPTDFNKRERRLCAFCYSCMYLHKGVRGCFFCVRRSCNATTNNCVVVKKKGQEKNKTERRILFSFAHHTLSANMDDIYSVVAISFKEKTQYSWLKESRAKTLTAAQQTCDSV